MSKPTVLFVCVHNAGRSQMAAGYLQHLAGDRIEVLSAGSEPADQVNRVAVQAMLEEGIDVATERPKILTTEAVQAADVVVTMGCGDACPFFPGKRYEDWELDDPAGRSIEIVRSIRNEIRRRVELLIHDLAPKEAQVTETDVIVSGMEESQWPAVEEIYRQGIATGHATFETEPPRSWADFISGKLDEHCWVAIDLPGNVVGWVAARAVSSRCVYAGVVEHSVYVDRRAAGRGIGQELLKALIGSTEDAGTWTIESGIFPENSRSLAAHRAVGFREVGRRERLGKMTYGPMAGVWRDVVLIERRSPLAGR